MDDAAGFDTSSPEEHVFTLLGECDQQLTLDWLQRCELIVMAYALGAAAGRAEFVVCEVAATLLIPDTTAGELLAEARLLLSLPALVGAVEAGRLRLPHARRVLTELLPVEDCLHEAVVADVLGRVAEQPPAAVGRIVRRAILRADPGAAEKRRKVAKKHRGLALYPARDGMADLVLKVDAEVGVRIFGLACAATDRDDGSGRSADARRSDWIVEQILRGVQSGPVVAGGAVPAVTGPAPDAAVPGEVLDGRRRRSCQALVTISVTTALGLDDEPCELTGYGPISAAHGRELIATAELRKVCLDARSGQVLHVDDRVLRPTPDKANRAGRSAPDSRSTGRAESRAGHGDGGRDDGATRPAEQPFPAHVRSALLTLIDTPSVQPIDPEPQYRPSASLARTVRARTPKCDFPCCSRSASRCDLEHTRPWPRGSTEATNLAPRSRRHHRAKQAGWTPSPLPDGSTLWSAPSGRTYRKPSTQ